jgi:hypothetical protein
LSVLSYKLSFEQPPSELGGCSMIKIVSGEPGGSTGFQKPELAKGVKPSLAG